MLCNADRSELPLRLARRAYVNTAKMMEMILNGGRCLDCGPHCPRWSRCGALGGHLGPDTGSMDRYASFEEVQQSVDAQFEYWTNQMCSSLCVIENAHRALKPLHRRRAAGSRQAQLEGL